MKTNFVISEVVAVVSNSNGVNSNSFSNEDRIFPFITFQTPTE